MHPPIRRVSRMQQRHAGPASKPSLRGVAGPGNLARLLRDSRSKASDAAAPRRRHRDTGGHRPPHVHSLIDIESLMNKPLTAALLSAGVLSLGVLAASAPAADIPPPVLPAAHPALPANAGAVLATAVAASSPA